MLTQSCDKCGAPVNRMTDTHSVNMSIFLEPGKGGRDVDLCAACVQELAIWLEPKAKEGG